MPSGRDLRELLSGYIHRDDEAVRRAALAIITDERAKNNKLLADDLEQILYSRGAPPPRRRQVTRVNELPKDRESGVALVDVAEHDYDWDRLVLASKTRAKLTRIVEEHHRREVLASAGLRPTQTVLFYGPPGCGKSISAAVLASLLSRPLVTIRLDALISSYLGETASNLRRVFDFLQAGTFVVLLDEFDAIGKDRDDHLEHGELKRLVNTLLQLMDAYRGDSLLIAATNHERLLDNAVWRRFEEIVGFRRPDHSARVRLLRLYLRGFNTSSLCAENLGKQLAGATGADIELAAIRGARRAVLDGRNSVTCDDISPAVAEFKERAILSGSPRSPGSRALAKESETAVGTSEP